MTQTTAAAPHHALIPPLGALPADAARAVLARLEPYPALAASRPVPDALVAAVAALSDTAAPVFLARNRNLTAEQLIRLIEAAGAPAVRAAFESFDGGGPRPDGAAVPAPRPRPEEALSVGITELRDPDCSPERAIALLRALPFLVHSARVPVRGEEDLAPLLHGLDLPKASLTALWDAGLCTAHAHGAVSPADLTDRVRPALVAVQALARLHREEPRYFPGAHLDALVRDRLGADPAAWAAFAVALPGHTGPLRPLLDAAHGAADAAGAPVIRLAGASRPAVLFLLRRLAVDQVEALLPRLADGDAADALVPGGVPPRDEYRELAFATGRPALLKALARHQHLRGATARRIHALGVPEYDRILAVNQAGTDRRFRGDVLGGVEPGGGPRRPVDPELRDLLIGNPELQEPFPLALSGDPALVAMAWQKCGRLRRIDHLDIVLALWERSGPESVPAVLTSIPADTVPKAVRLLVDRAVPGRDVTVLRAARAALVAKAEARIAASRAAAEAEPLGEEPETMADRVRERPLEPDRGWEIQSAVHADLLDPAVLVSDGRPAGLALDELAALHAAGSAGEGPARLAAALGPRPETWAVFAQLLPTFTGTPTELATLSHSASQ